MIVAGKGHNSGPVNLDRLKSIVERAENLIGEKKAIQSDIVDIFSEAKSAGYDVKTLRRVIKARAMDGADRDEQEALYDTYMAALDAKVAAAVGKVQTGEMSLGEAAKAAGVSKSQMHRSVPRKSDAENFGTIPHDSGADDNPMPNFLRRPA